jgi:acetyltransferase-like isoleucine patch superfamily enzyme
MNGFPYNFLLYTYNYGVAWVPSHRFRRFFLHHIMRVSLGERCAILLGLRLYAKGRISIGAHSVIDRNCVLDGRGGIMIGANVNLAPEVMILTAYHDPDSDDFVGIEKGVVIEDYVWIATRATILPGVRIGSRAIVGAGSVVTKDVASGAVVAGNPARVIRERKGEQTYQLDYQRLFH